MRPGSALSSLTGSLELAQFDTGALGRFDLSRAGFWQSFSVVLLMAPLVVLYMYLSNTYQLRLGQGPNSVPAFVLIYLLDWTAFTLLMIPVSQLLGAGAQYVAFITVYNWCRPVAICFGMFAYAVGAAGLANADGMFFLYYLAISLRSLYLGFVMHATLRVGIGAILGLLLLDIIVGLFVIEGVAALLQPAS